MGVEIERKFLVDGDAWRTLGEATLLRQGYLSLEPTRTVRVRIDGERAFLTIKGKSVGASRGEWEYPIPRQDAEELLTLASKYIGHTFKCLSLTLEMPFKDNADLPNPHTGWNGARSAALGAAMLQPILQSLD